MKKKKSFEQCNKKINICMHHKQLLTCMITFELLCPIGYQIGQLLCLETLYAYTLMYLFTELAMLFQCHKMLPLHDFI